jgi:hypothetical protein
MPKIFFTVTFIILISSSQIFSQVKTELTPYFTGIIKPPASCTDAYSYSQSSDTSAKVKMGAAMIAEQELRLKKLQYDISFKLKSLKNQMNDSQMPPGGMKPPQGNSGMPGSNAIPEEIILIRKEVEKCKTAGENTTKYLDKLKSEIEIAQYDFNFKLKKTIAEDSLSRVLITDEFLSKIIVTFNKYLSLFQDNAAIIDKSIKNLENETEFRIPPMQIDLLKAQDSEVYSALFLLNITKECAKIGAKFYVKPQEN